MAILEITTNSVAEAKKYILKAYEADRQGGLQNGGLTFAGRVITAVAKGKGNNWTVKVSSDWYQLDSLETIFYAD